VDSESGVTTIVADVMEDAFDKTMAPIELPTIVS
jgi:hypothetical protein